MKIDLYQGDCLEVMKLIDMKSIDAIVTDPPWGINQNSDNTRLKNCRGNNKTYKQIIGDDIPFDPSVWISYPKVAMFGANCFSDKLPLGAWLIWCKRRESMMGTFLADAETIWINKGFGVYILMHEWSGSLKASEINVERVHPHQKPIPVMKWIFERLGLEKGCTILDPYMGSCATGIAAYQMEMNFIGIEKDPHYFAIAQKRIKDAQYQSAMFNIDWQS